MLFPELYKIVIKFNIVGFTGGIPPLDLPLIVGWVGQRLIVWRSAANSWPNTHSICPEPGNIRIVSSFARNSTMGGGGPPPSVELNFWLHTMCACTEWYSTYQIRWDNLWL